MFDGAKRILISDVDQDRCLVAYKIPNLSMCHLLVNTNQDIKKR